MNISIDTFPDFPEIETGYIYGEINDLEDNLVRLLCGEQCTLRWNADNLNLGETITTTVQTIHLSNVAETLYEFTDTNTEQAGTLEREETITLPLTFPVEIANYVENGRNLEQRIRCTTELRRPNGDRHSRFTHIMAYRGVRVRDFYRFTLLSRNPDTGNFGYSNITPKRITTLIRNAEQEITRLIRSVKELQDTHSNRWKALIDPTGKEAPFIAPARTIQFSENANTFLDDMKQLKDNINQLAVIGFNKEDFEDS
jgi:hypothetical protein